MYFLSCSSFLAHHLWGEIPGHWHLQRIISSYFFKVFFCFFANYSNRLRGVGVIAGQRGGTYFSLIFSQKRHLAQRRRVFPGFASHSLRLILSLCVIVHTEHLKFYYYIHPHRNLKVVNAKWWNNAFRIIIIHQLLFHSFFSRFVSEPHSGSSVSGVKCEHVSVAR